MFSVCLWFPRDNPWYFKHPSSGYHVTNDFLQYIHNGQIKINFNSKRADPILTRNEHNFTQKLARSTSGITNCCSAKTDKISWHSHTLSHETKWRFVLAISWQLNVDCVQKWVVCAWLVAHWLETNGWPWDRRRLHRLPLHLNLFKRSVSSIKEIVMMCIWPALYYNCESVEKFADESFTHPKRSAKASIQTNSMSVLTVVHCNMSRNN
jgi:hypothetical protein